MSEQILDGCQLETQREQVKGSIKKIHQLGEHWNSPDDTSAAHHSVSFIRLTLQNTIVMLTDLDEAMAVLQKQGATSTPAVQQVELINALRRTVMVLEKTKQNFKSKDLGALRQELSCLLAKL